MMNKVGVQIDEKLTESAKQQIQEIDQLLSSPKFATINKDFDQKRRSKNGSSVRKRERFHQRSIIDEVRVVPKTPREDGT